MKWFGRHFEKKKSPDLNSALRNEDMDESPSMHIIALDPTTKEVVGVVARGHEDAVSVPAITTDGRISFLPAGNMEDFAKLQQAVSDRMTKQHPTLTSATNVAVVAVNISPNLEESSTYSCFIFEVLGSTEPMPELEHIYYLLTRLREVGDKHWNEVKDFLSSEPRKSWINNVIEIWKQKLNWAEYVNRALEYYQQSSQKDE